MTDASWGCVVRGLDHRVVAGGRVSLVSRMATSGAVEDGPYRLRSASEASWAGSVTYGQQETVWQKITGAVSAVLRMVVPVSALLASFVGLYLYRDTPLPLFLDGTTSWLTAGHLLLPVGFFCIHLTNRRYGPAYAFAQVVIASALVTALVVVDGARIGSFLPQDTLPTMREAISFGTAFFIASFISITVFDGARGRHWWTAPLFGFFTAAIFFALIFFPAAYAGSSELWFAHGMKFMGLMAGEGIVLLIPYWLLRGMIPPLSGFGGY
ncbi:MAG: VUT family protein [Alphaproteobacteria bacterium]|nr:VUT family protein [Alphaproteobacteria bacterium]MDE2629925.1 VUT family protein [Alphaproteobacteria bacterium]